MRRKSLLLTVVGLLILSNLGTYAISTGRVPWFSRLGFVAEGDPAYRTFREVLGRIQREYVDEAVAMDTDRLLEGATAGLVESLEDPYSEYMAPEEFKQFITQSVGGTYTGVGVEITSLDGYVTVIAPIKNTPAYRAGIMPLDRIVAVDGVSIVGWTPQEATHLIRGKPGTEVVLSVRREGLADDLEIRIVREVIEIPTVEARMLEPGIGYLQIAAFRDDTARDFRQALEQLKAQGLKVLLLDLRDNPGGLLDQSVKVAEAIVPTGTIVTTLYRNGRREVYSAPGPGLGLPVITLVNGFSASASEVLAGAIKDRGAGQLLGTKSFGKALVQSILYMPDGGGLKLTSARYLTPNGTDINRKPDGTGGITPDVIVENAAVKQGEQRIQLDDLSDPRNVQLQRALELARQRAT